jgi:hypothetical protein
MSRQRRHRFTLYLMLTVAIVALLPAAITAHAQDSGPGLIQTAEYDIGLDCPVASALDPTGEAIYILMNNCGSSRYYLLVLDADEGFRLPVDDYAADLAVLNGTYIDLFIMPLAFNPDGDLSLRFNDPDTYVSFNLVIPVATGGEVTLTSSDSYDALLAELADYPEFTVYSPDHTRAVTGDRGTLHVIDVSAETVLASIPLEAGAEYALANFSDDGTELEVTLPVDPDDMSRMDSRLYVYRIMDGTLTGEFPVPSPALWRSPDGTRAAVQLFSNNIGERSELQIVDLSGGAASATSNLLEAPQPVTICLNDGRSVSDLGLVRSGYLTLVSLHWLPDSSGIALTLSSNGEGVGGGAPCFFNYSRLRTYRVE